MTRLLIRFLIGGVVVSLFALIGSILKPKSFAGIFGAAPSIALATLALTVSSEGASYAAMEARSMMAGSIALLVYASCVSRCMMHYPWKAVTVTIAAVPLWLLVAFGLWWALLRA